MAKVQVKDKEGREKDFDLVPKDEALVLAIQELTKVLQRMAQNG